MRFEAPICGVWMWQPEQTAQRPRGDAGGPGAPAGDPLGGRKLPGCRPLTPATAPRRPLHKTSGGVSCTRLEAHHPAPGQRWAAPGGRTGTVAASMWDSVAQQLRVQEASAAPGRGHRGEPARPVGSSVSQGMAMRPEQVDVTGSQPHVSEPGEPCWGCPHAPWGQGSPTQHDRGTGAGREGTAPQSGPRVPPCPCDLACRKGRGSSRGSLS